MKRTKIKEILQDGVAGNSVTVMGWVRTKRESKNVAFLAVNDGSTINNIQIVVDVNDEFNTLLHKIHTGASISAEGLLVESSGSGQRLEMQCQKLEVIGEANPEEYPLQPKKHSLEFLREIAHLRFRTNLFGAITRVRHSMIFAVHKFFNDKGFYNIHTPIITASDAEGAGEMFRVSVLNPNNLPLTEDGKVDFSKDFFGKETNLTVSGQLEG
ncbi:MAG: asparagine--tRNA ligase, partial [Bacteroidales bacterium]|nr:asparagine--tRNA ligase [Bacteroidales bacterium]